MPENEKLLDAYNMIKTNCNLRGSCDGCLFQMDENSWYDCIFECVNEGDFPRHWTELEV